MSDTDIRLACLRLAIDMKYGEAAEDVLAFANDLYRFVMNGGPQ